MSAATASAQPARTGSVAEIAYRAPASCPSRSTFEQRLRARLGASPDARLPAALSIALSLAAAQAVGEITVTSGPRSGARRRVTAASCDEAVDALTLVTALLIEPEKPSAEVRPDAQRAATPAASGRNTSPSRSRTPSPTAEEASRNGPTPQSTSARAATPNDAATAERRDSPPAEPSESESENEARRESERPSEKPPKSAAGAAKGPTESEREAPAQGAVEDDDEQTRVGQASGLQLELAVAALLALETLPSPRPGLLGRVALALPLSRAWALALELSGRGLLPQRERSPEGDARFRFYAGGAGLCARHDGGRLASSMCAQAELGQLAAEGENTSNPQRARALWSALGPGARAALEVAGPLALHAGLELLFPTSRDRFEVGSTALFMVPRLTFRMELGLGVHFE